MEQTDSEQKSQDDGQGKDDDFFDSSLALEEVCERMVGCGRG